MYYNVKKYLWLMVVVVLASCRSQQIIVPNDTITQTTTTMKTIERDSIYLHDSIYIHEYTKGDTIFFNKIVEHWKDRWLTKTDTITRNDSTTIYQPVEVIKEVKHVPGFYKWCTGLFWLLVVLVIGKMALKIWKLVKV